MFGKVHVNLFILFPATRRSRLGVLLLLRDWHGEYGKDATERQEVSSINGACIPRQRDSGTIVYPNTINYTLLVQSSTRAYNRAPNMYINNTPWSHIGRGAGCTSFFYCYLSLFALKRRPWPYGDLLCLSRHALKLLCAQSGTIALRMNCINV